MAKKNSSTKKTEAQRPAAEFRINGTKAVVWENETRNGSMFNVQLVKVYRDDEGEWHETHSLGRDDLLSAAKVLDQAHSWIWSPGSSD